VNSGKRSPGSRPNNHRGKEYEMTTKKCVLQVKICGKKIWIDQSGVGHCWVPATPGDCSGEEVDEIAAQILDHGEEECEEYLAQNGWYYQW